MSEKLRGDFLTHTVGNPFRYTQPVQVFQRRRDVVVSKRSIVKRAAALMTHSHCTRSRFRQAQQCDIAVIDVQWSSLSARLLQSEPDTNHQDCRLQRRMSFYMAAKSGSYRHHIKAVEAFRLRCLRGILGMRWWHKVLHAEIRCRANINSMEYIVMQRQLQWLGHVTRMPSNRLSRHVLYGELLQGPRSQGGQKKQFSDHIKATLKKCHIPADELETLAEETGLHGETPARLV